MTKASICHWSLRASFYTKQQVVDAITMLLAEEIDFNLSFSVELEATRTAYVLEIDEMPWAENLTTVAQILERVDHKD
jgi:hypothetical protein